MRKDGVLYVLKQDKPDADTAKTAQTHRFNTDDSKNHHHIVLNLEEERATIFTSLLISYATMKEVRKKLTDSCQKEKMQSKLNLRCRIHNVSYLDDDNFPENLKHFEEIFLELVRLSDPVPDGDKTGILF